MTHRELAGALAVDQTLISAWERGRTAPSVESIEKLASIFEVPVDKLTSPAVESGRLPAGSGAGIMYSEEDLRRMIRQEVADQIEKKLLDEFRAIGCSIHDLTARLGLNDRRSVARPPLRMTAAQGPQYEATGIILEFPAKPADLTAGMSDRWDRNELALRRWEKSGKAFPAPAKALERFCLEAANFYQGGTLADIGALLKEFMEEGK